MVFRENRYLGGYYLFLKGLVGVGLDVVWSLSVVLSFFSICSGSRSLYGSLGICIVGRILVVRRWGFRVLK